MCKEKRFLMFVDLPTCSFLLDDRRRDVRTIGVYVQSPGFRDDDEIHILHRNRTKQDLIAHDQSPREPDAILETQLDGTHVRDQLLGPVRQGNFLVVDGFQLESDLNVLGNAKMHRARVTEGHNVHRGKLRKPWILEQDLSVYEIHSIKIPLSIPKRRTIDSPYTTWSGASSQGCAPVSIWMVA